MNKDLLLGHLRSIPDFPVKGVLFRDITTLYQDPVCLQEMATAISSIYLDKGITKVVGIESRGFITGAAVAARLGAGFVPVRKPGKLPAKSVSETYSKEYGTDTIEIHVDAIDENDVVLLLATGGTTAAAVELVKKFSPERIYANFVIELSGEFPEARKAIPSDVEISTLLKL